MSKSRQFAIEPDSNAEDKGLSQVERFRAVARELGADDADEDRFNAALEKVGKASSPKQADQRRAKAEETNRAAQEIIAGEAAAREQNRSRLKAERLAKDTAEPPKPPIGRGRSRKTEA